VKRSIPIKWSNVVVHIICNILYKVWLSSTTASVFLDTAAFISNLCTSLYEDENPRLYSVSMRNREPKWWWSWIANPICKGAITPLGLVACITSCTIANIFVEESVSLNKESKNMHNECGT
jgi:hypothetical protein